MEKWSDLDHIPKESFTLQPFLRGERHWLVCRTCRKRHTVHPNDEVHLAQAILDWKFKHPVERGCVAVLMTPAQIEAMMRRAERRRKSRHDRVIDFSHNADVKLAFQGTTQSLDTTGLGSLASSTTNGWGSQAIDNSANLYLDYYAQLVLAAVNMAPGDSQTIYIYGASSYDLTTRPTTGAASNNVFTSSLTTAGTLTYPNVVTSAPNPPLIRAQPYTSQNALTHSPLFAFAAPLGLYLWYGLVNHAGFTFAASGNSLSYRGVYSTVI